MTSDAHVYATLSLSGIPGAYLSWGPSSCLPPLPFFTYERRLGSPFTDSQATSLPRYRVYVHADEHTDLEPFEARVRELGAYVRQTRREDGCLVVRYDFTLTGVVE